MEKLLKSLLCQIGVKYTRTHDLEYLSHLLRDHGEVVGKGAFNMAQIESFGVAYRYDALPEADVLDRSEALESLRVIREYVVARVAALSGTP